MDGILEEIESTGYDAHLRAAWVHSLSRVVAPLRYPVHGLQMIASYIGQMAPSGRITITAALQSGDEMRRIQRIAYRIRQLQQIYPGFGNDGKTLWETDSLWQPMREVIERLLVTYDWAESFIGLNLVLKPLIDELFMKHLSDRALKDDDYLLGQILFSLNEDCQWHRQWSKALIETAMGDNARNRDMILGWIWQWYPLAIGAVQPFAKFIDSRQSETSPPEGTEQLIDCEYRNYLRSMNLELAS